MNDALQSVTVGGEVAGAKVSLRLFAEDIDPDRVTAQLGIEPTLAFRAGDRVSSRSAARRKEGTWQFESQLPEGLSIEEHIVGILKIIPNELSDWEQLTRSLRKDIFCWITIESQVSGLSIGVETLDKLARFGLNLELDLVVQNESDDA